MLEAIVYVLFVGSNFAMHALKIDDYTSHDNFEAKCFRSSKDLHKPENRISTIFGVNNFKGQFSFKDQLQFYYQQPPNTWYVADLLKWFDIVTSLLMNPG